MSRSTPTMPVVLDALRELYAPCAPGEFPRRLLRVVSRLLPSLHYTWDELRRVGEPPDFYSLHDLSSVMPMHEFFQLYTTHVGQHPIVQNSSPIVPSAVHFVTDFASQREWERTDFQQLVLRPFGVRYQIAAQVRTDFLYGGLIINGDRPFTEDNRRFFEMLLPHIRQARDNAERMTALQLEREHGGRFAGGSSLVCDAAGEFGPLLSSAHALLREFFPSVRTWNGAVPEPVKRWAQTGLTQFLQLRGLPTPPADWVVRGARGVLRLSLHPDFRQRWHTVSLHVLRPVAAPAPAAVGRQLGLTPREGEVLHWLAEGKRNAEIAIILASTPGTVRKQAESIFEKLRVETRGAAAAMYYRTARGLG